ncbi:acid phosphatase [Ampullimonas aquatilis]|uniref:acid phosphatase n=1 Tax=Ampullimonas aquatilis TaxID=1341549 RepID=UPI003C796CB5
MARSVVGNQHWSKKKTAEPSTNIIDATLRQIQNVVIIYGENRSFDHLYGMYPGVNGITAAFRQGRTSQLDLDGTSLRTLPPVWQGINANLLQTATKGLPNQPFRLDDPAGFNQPLGSKIRDLDHSFFYNQMQINGGRNDRFVNASDAGALPMGYYDGSSLPMWQLARQFTLADNFYMGAFGGSFLNHFWLVCACTPVYPNAESSPAKSKIANPGGEDGVSLLLDPSRKIDSLLDDRLQGRPPYLGNGAITPINARFDQHYAVNTMQPPYQPSYVRPASIATEADAALANPDDSATLPPQNQLTIGDVLSEKQIGWAWYAGAWQLALADGMQDREQPRTIIYNNSEPNFQPHHQPLNYFSQFAPGTAARSQHLKDGIDFMAAIADGTLPQVAFYKPQGNLNEHPGYADVLSGDQHIANLVRQLMAGPQWPHMLIIVTYDENGGFWDHAAPPKGDIFGPATRIPAILISPFAKRGHIDHSLYDTTSILRLLTRRFELTPLPGLITRQQAVKSREGKVLGDLTEILITSKRASEARP